MNLKILNQNSFDLCSSVLINETKICEEIYVFKTRFTTSDFFYLWDVGLWFRFLHNLIFIRILQVYSIFYSNAAL